MSARKLTAEVLLSRIIYYKIHMSRVASAQLLRFAARDTRVAIAAALATAATLPIGTQEARAQNAANPVVTELPPIEITSPSPVAKPSRRRAAAPQAAAPATQGAAEDVPPAPDVLPGTLIVSDDSFVAVTVATSREIEATRGSTITDTLQSKPGIIGSTFAPGANRPIIRGLDSYRVRVQEDGIGTHDVSALSEDHAVPVDPYSADRVEVVRGPATLRYGSQAIGGVVAIENQRIPTFMPQGGFSGEIKGGGASVDDSKDGAFQATAGSKGMVVHADGFWRKADDYDTPRGTVDNSFVDSKGGSLGASIVGSDGFLGVAFARVESLYGIPGEEAAIDLEQDKVLARGEWRVRSGGIDAVRFWFGASDYGHDEVTGDEVGSRFSNREQEARVEVQHTPAGTMLGELTGAIGVQWGHRNLRAQSFEGDSLLDPAETDNIAAFWFEELALTSKLHLQGAARIEHSNVDGSGLADVSDPLNPVAFAGERSFTPVSASVGLLYDFPMGVVGRITGQYVERAPDAAELFSQGVHEATGTFEVGNPFLETEKARTIEVGLRRGVGSFRFDTSAYYTSYDGFIFKELTDVKCGDDLASCGQPGVDELDLLIFGQRDATFYGAEVAAQYDVAPIWRGLWGIDAQYDFVRAEFEDGENLQRIPPHRLGGGLYYRDPNWFARAGVLHAFDQDQIGINEIETPGYTLVSAELSYTVQGRTEDGITPVATIGIKGENLADDEVLNHASFMRREDILLPGASVRLFGSIKLN
jgi:iron complex outermembrane receptor protein